MKKTWIVCVMTVMICSPVFAETDSEILFRNIPWGSSYTEVESDYGTDLLLVGMHGDWMRNFPVDDVLFNPDDGIDLVNDDLCINAYSSNKESIDVAGYTPTDISLYFAFTPVNGVLTHEESDSAFYAASYEFEPKDIEGMYSDLLSKLTSLYGEPDDTKEVTRFSDSYISGVFWYGDNDTVVSLRKEPNDSFDLGDHIFISYAWKKGDELLVDADRVTTQMLTDDESSNFGSGNTSGL